MECATPSMACSMASPASAEARIMRARASTSPGASRTRGNPALTSAKAAAP